MRRGRQNAKERGALNNRYKPRYASEPIGSAAKRAAQNHRRSRAQVFHDSVLLRRQRCVRHARIFTLIELLGSILDHRDTDCLQRCQPCRRYASQQAQRHNFAELAAGRVARVLRIVEMSNSSQSPRSRRRRQSYRPCVTSRRSRIRREGRGEPRRTCNAAKRICGRTSRALKNPASSHVPGELGGSSLT